MLHEFVTSNHEELIRRCQEKVAKRLELSELPVATDHGVPLFLQQLVDTLRAEQLTPIRATPAAESAPSPSEIGRAAALHGAELLRLGFTIDQVVHEYGDVCQSVTELAIEKNAMIASDEFRTLNRCLDNAIADAVTSFGRAHHDLVADRAGTAHARLDAFTWEQARLIDTATQAFCAIRTGGVGVSGATGQLLMHSLTELRFHTERTLPQLRRSLSAITDD